MGSTDIFEIQAETENSVIKENKFCIACKLNESGIKEYFINSGCIDLLDIVQSKSIIL